MKWEIYTGPNKKFRFRLKDGSKTWANGSGSYDHQGDVEQIIKILPNPEVQSKLRSDLSELRGDLRVTHRTCSYLREQNRSLKRALNRIKVLFGIALVLAIIGLFV